MINRGNYRRDVFESVGAAKAFEVTLEETCEKFQWRLHAYVIMRNHFHLAVETVEPNLVDGMHWLQSTFATRFNRLRAERGHLFQGRYQSLLIEDAGALARVVNYVHLNPVRARIVAAEQVASFRWSSLGRLAKASRPAWLVAEEWLSSAGWTDSPEGWRGYVAALVELAGDAERQREQGFGEMTRGWAIGTKGWRTAVAKDHAHLTLSAGFVAKEIQELKETRWRGALERVLRQVGKTAEAVRTDAKGAAWKRAAAATLRDEANAPHRWIAQVLNMGCANSVRSYLSRARTGENQQLSA